MLCFVLVRSTRSTPYVEYYSFERLVRRITSYVRTHGDIKPLLLNEFFLKIFRIQFGKDTKTSHRCCCCVCSSCIAALYLLLRSIAQQHHKTTTMRYEQKTTLQSLTREQQLKQQQQQIVILTKEIEIACEDDRLHQQE